MGRYIWGDDLSAQCMQILTLSRALTQHLENNHQYHHNNDLIMYLLQCLIYKISNLLLESSATPNQWMSTPYTSAVSAAHSMLYTDYTQLLSFFFITVSQVDKLKSNSTPRVRLSLLSEIISGYLRDERVFLL